MTSRPQPFNAHRRDPPTRRGVQCSYELLVLKDKKDLKIYHGSRKSDEQDDDSQTTASTWGQAPLKQRRRVTIPFQFRILIASSLGVYIYY